MYDEFLAAPGDESKGLLIFIAALELGVSVHNHIHPSPYICTQSYSDECGWNECGLDSLLGKYGLALNSRSNSFKAKVCNYFQNSLQI